MAYRSISITPTIQASAYSAGNSLGGLITIDLGMGQSAAPMLKSIQVNDKGGHTPAITLYFFSAAPTGTVTDKTAIALNAADIPNTVAVVSFLTTDYKAPTAGFSVANRSAIDEVIGTSGTNLYVVISVDSGFTPSTTTDINIKLGFV